MEQLINTLIEIDEKATLKLEEAKAEGEKLILDAKNAADRKRKSLLERADARMVKVREFYESLINEETEKQNDRLSVEIREMDEKWANKKDSVFDSIYKEILE